MNLCTKLIITLAISIFGKKDVKSNLMECLNINHHVAPNVGFISFNTSQYFFIELNLFSK